MTYSIKWFPINISYEQRFNVYLNNYFFENEVRTNLLSYYINYLIGSF